MNKQSTVALTAVALLGAFAFGTGLYNQQRADKIGFLAQEEATILVPAHAQTLGEEDARVYIVEFFDPACETCMQMYHPVKQILESHPGQIRLVLRYAPFHEGSDKVVKMLEASKEQGKYWETLELMFASQSYWASHHNPQPELLWEFLPKAGVDVDRLRVAMDNPAIDAIVAQDVADAATLGVRMTPEYFVNGKPLPSFGLAQLEALVDAELAAQYP